MSAGHAAIKLLLENGVAVRRQLMQLMSFTKPMLSAAELCRRPYCMQQCALSYFARGESRAARQRELACAKPMGRSDAGAIASIVAVWHRINSKLNGFCMLIGIAVTWRRRRERKPTMLVRMKSNAAIAWHMYQSALYASNGMNSGNKVACCTTA